MALLDLSYRSYNLNRVINVQYNDVTHEVTNGSLGTTEGVSGIGPGVEFWRQDDGTDHWSIRVQDASPYAYVFYYSTAIAQDLEITGVNILNAMNGDPGAVEGIGIGTGTKRWALLPIVTVPQVSEQFPDIPAGDYTLVLSRTEDEYSVTRLVTVLAIPDLQATVTSTPATANGADDGTVTVTNLTGSGNYEIDFITESVVVSSDGSAPVVRVALAPGVYDVSVTDNVTGQVTYYQAIVTEPAEAPGPVLLGTILDVPALNSIKFVVANNDVEQGLDNRLLCEQEYGDYQKENYFQKYNRGDKPKVQFYSNYSNHYIELKKYSDDSFVVGFPIIKLETNVGRIDEFVINLVEGDPGQTLVYFDTRELPLPLEEGANFTIADNVDFNGVYSIVSIGVDEDSFQYLVITKAFGAPGSTVANGQFINTAIPYDVYETIIDLTSVANGQYYLELTAYTSAQNIKKAYSEPLEIALRHADCLLIVYNNYDNAFGVTWTTGYVGFKRVEGLFGHKRPTNGERTVSRDANYSLTKVSARKTRNIMVEMFGLPPYLHEELSVIFDTDVFSINNVPCQSSEGLQSQNLEESILVDDSIVVEQKNWFNKYNSNDNLMSSVSETADCACDEIDLVPVASTPATITLNFNGKRQRIFKLQPAFSTNKVIALATSSLALSFKLKFSITQDFVDDARYIQFPAIFKSNAGAPLWDSATQRYAPIDAGTYEAEASFDGSNWQVVFQQSTFN